MTTSIDAVTLLTIMYVLVDDWYQQQGQALLKGKAGRKPSFSDSEIITLMLAMDFIPFPSETQFIGFIRANYRGLFPRLVDPSEFNCRARKLRLLVEALRRKWVIDLGGTQERQFLLDTKPVPVVGYKRSKRHSDFAGSAAYGYCSSRNLHYFGYKLVLLSPLEGLPIVYDLVPANLEEREAAEAVIFSVAHCDLFGDKGFLSDDWQALILDLTGNRLWTAKRENQHVQNPPAFDALLNRVRERIEGAFNEVQNTGRNLERLLAKTVVGLSTRIIAKMTSHALKLLLRRDYGIHVQTFELVPI